MEIKQENDKKINVMKNFKYLGRLDWKHRNRSCCEKGTGMEQLIKLIKKGKSVTLCNSDVSVAFSID